MLTQGYTAAQFAAAATAASQDTAGSSGTLELTRLEDRRRIRIFAQVTGGGSATLKLLVGRTSSVVVVADSATSVGTAGAMLDTELGPFGYVALDWSSNSGTVVAEASAHDGED